MLFKKLGFPIINNFAGDIREFTPGLFKILSGFDVEPVLENGYGSRLGFTHQDYLDVFPAIRFADREEVFHQDMLIVLKNPDLEDLEMLNDGSGLFSMIHYDTRPGCVELIHRKHIKAFSMDSMVDDQGIRTFVDYFGTAYAGCETAFDVLKQTREDFASKDRKPYVATIIGAGGVAQGCVRSLEVLSDKELFANQLPGIITQVITRSITTDEENLKKVLNGTDILIDASKRPDPSKFILTNEQLGYLPENAIILDISADHYDTSVTPILVKAFEGIIKGTYDKRVIYTDDPEYDEVPEGVSTANRRITVSCDAWPSIHPHKSIVYYEGIMRNYMDLLLGRDTETLDVNSNNFFERSLYRGTIKYFDEKEAKNNK